MKCNAVRVFTKYILIIPLLTMIHHTYSNCKQYHTKLIHAAKAFLKMCDATIVQGRCRYQGV